MWALHLAWKNLWRNRTRTVVSLSAVFFSVVLASVSYSLQDGIFSHFVRNMVGYYTGYVQIHQAGYWDEPVIDNAFRLSPEAHLRLRAQSDLEVYSPRLESFALIASANTTRGCLVAGIDPLMESRIIMLDRRLSDGVYPADSTTANFGLVTEGLALRMGVGLRDTLILLGQGYHGTLAVGKIPVTGILRFGAPELNNNLLFISLEQARGIFGAGEGDLATSWVLLPGENSVPEKISAGLGQSLGRSYEVMTWREMLPEVDQHIRIDQGSLRITSIVIYLLVASGVLGTLMMMVAERRREFGILVAIGMQKETLSLVLWIESLIQVLLGTFIGMAVGFLIARWLNTHPIRPGKELADMFVKFGFEPVFPASVNPEIFLNQGLVMVILILSVSLIPVLSIRSLDPVAAIKR